MWEILISNARSWAWRNILKLKGIVKDKVKCFIGNGEDTYLWNDNWHSFGHLKTKYGNRIIYESGLGNNAKVCEIIREGKWRWLYTNSWALMEIKNMMGKDS